MRKFGYALTLVSALACGLGCSQGTADKAEKAVDAAGEAAASAADDVKDAAAGAADDMKDAVDDATGHGSVEQ